MTASAIDAKLDIEFARLRDRIDAALDRYARFDDGCPPRLAEAIRYALLGPGKRLRPQLVLLAAEACGGTLEAALPAACAVEMVHAYSLVHDDLPAMDDDDLRRGRPTCHIVFGEATAILVGDALLARAFEILATDIKPPTIAARCCAVLARAAGACALVGGQADDLMLAARGADSQQTDGKVLESIRRRKTGALFVASLELGGVVAEASLTQLAALVTYGEQVGLAFQITDDLLDERHPVSVADSRRRVEELIADACAMIDILGTQAESLRKLAQYIGHREN